MTIISSTLVLRIHALLTLYASHLLLSNPSSLLTQNLVLFLGSSMRLPDPDTSTFLGTTTSSSLGVPNAACALAALVLAILSVSDLAATALPTFAYDEFWGLIAPVRIFVFMGVAGWTYAMGRGLDEEMGVSTFRGGLLGGRKGERVYGGELINTLVFSWAFVEMSLMLWVFIKLRDERKQTAARIVDERAQKENRL